jgi:hypothetical protein
LVVRAWRSIWCPAKAPPAAPTTVPTSPAVRDLVSHHGPGDAADHRAEPGALALLLYEPHAHHHAALDAFFLRRRRRYFGLFRLRARQDSGHRRNTDAAGPRSQLAAAPRYQRMDAHF